MDFGARSAGASLCHLPKVIFATGGNQVVRVKPRLAKPSLRSFAIFGDLPQLILEGGRPNAVFV